MSLLKIEDATFENVEGEVVSQESKMIGFKKSNDDEEIPTMKIKPIVGDEFTEFIKLANTKPGESDDAEAKLIELLINHIEEPKFTAKQFKLVKPIIMESIMKTVMHVSGLPIEQLEMRRVKQF